MPAGRDIPLAQGEIDYYVTATNPQAIHGEKAQPEVVVYYENNRSREEEEEERRETL